jgi:hypothetical protein
MSPLLAWICGTLVVVAALAYFRREPIKTWWEARLEENPAAVEKQIGRGIAWTLGLTMAGVVALGLAGWRMDALQKRRERRTPGLACSFCGETLVGRYWTVARTGHCPNCGRRVAHDPAPPPEPDPARELMTVESFRAGVRADFARQLFGCFTFCASLPIAMVLASLARGRRPFESRGSPPGSVADFAEIVGAFAIVIAINGMMLWIFSSKSKADGRVHCWNCNNRLPESQRSTIATGQCRKCGARVLKEAGEAGS